MATAIAVREESKKIEQLEEEQRRAAERALIEEEKKRDEEETRLEEEKESARVEEERINLAREEKRLRKVKKAREAEKRKWVSHAKSKANNFGGEETPPTLNKQPSKVTEPTMGTIGHRSPKHIARAQAHRKGKALIYLNKIEKVDSVEEAESRPTEKELLSGSSNSKGSRISRYVHDLTDEPSTEEGTLHDGASGKSAKRKCCEPTLPDSSKSTLKKLRRKAPPHSTVRIVQNLEDALTTIEDITVVEPPRLDGV